MTRTAAAAIHRDRTFDAAIQGPVYAQQLYVSAWQRAGDFVSQGISLPVAYGAISVTQRITAGDGTSEHPYCAGDWPFVWRENSTLRSLFSGMVVARSIWSSGTEFWPP